MNLQPSKSGSFMVQLVGCSPQAGVGPATGAAVKIEEGYIGAGCAPRRFMLCVRLGGAGFISVDVCYIFADTQNSKLYNQKMIKHKRTHT